jgi:predicted transcriptional regulator
MEEETGELLFLLSSADRLKLLYALREDRLRPSRLSSMLSITVQETSRQLSRLQAAGLIERDSRGLCFLTGVGRVALQLLPSFEFLAQRRRYLLSHDLSFIPPEFVERLGELGQNEYVETLARVLDHFEQVLSEARRYVWLMADQVLMVDAIAEKLLDGGPVTWRIIIPAAVAKEEDYRFPSNDFKGRVELGLLGDVRLGMSLNEKTAGVTFPDREGRVDFDSGLRSSDPSFHRWCEDYFLFQWGGAKKVF